MSHLLLVCAGGAIGAGCRYLLNTAAVRLLMLDVAWATLTVNILGSCAMGAIIAYISHKFPQDTLLKAFITTGMLGGFTTFSAFSLDTLRLLERGDFGLALLYVSSSVVLSITACAVAYFGIRTLIA